MYSNGLSNLRYSYLSDLNYICSHRTSNINKQAYAASKLVSNEYGNVTRLHQYALVYQSFETTMYLILSIFFDNLLYFYRYIKYDGKLYER